jgi:hypothetical protein
MPKRIERIRKENERLKKKSPYNFCDRWCEQCPDSIQNKCRVYQVEFEQKVTNISLGRDPDDHEIIPEIFEAHFGNALQGLEDFAVEHDTDTDAFDAQESVEEEGETGRRVDKHPVTGLCDKYMGFAHKFIQYAYREYPAAKKETETIARYHMLLAVKMKRALTGILAADDKDEFGLHDGVAQLDVCAKAVTGSLEALRGLRQACPDLNKSCAGLIALLHRVSESIGELEENIG